MHEVTVEDQQIPRLDKHGDGLGHVVIDDFDVPEVGILPPIGDVGVDRFPVGPGQHPEATVLQGRVADGQPETNLGRVVEGEVERGLGPGLTPGSGMFENER